MRKMEEKQFGFEMITWLMTHDPLTAKMMESVKMTKVEDYTGILGFFGCNWFIRQAERDGRKDPKVYTKDDKILVETYGRNNDIVIVIDDIKYFWLVDSYLLLCFVQNEFTMSLFNKRMEAIYGD